MKTTFKLLFTFTIFLFIACNNNSKTKTTTNSKIEAEKKVLSDAEKTAIVKYYLINKRKLSQKDIFKIIFLNDAFDTVKVIHYEGRDSFFTFKFSLAYNYYNKHY